MMQEWDGTEAQAMEDNSDGGAADDMAEREAEERFHDRQDSKKRYQIAKAAKVGSKIFCPGCGKLFVKTTYNKVFCSNGRTVKGQSSCKDRYHNMANPRGTHMLDFIDD